MAVTIRWVFRLQVSVLLPSEWWWKFLSHSNIEAVLNKRQPGDSSRKRMEISVFTFLCYPGTLMYLCILALLYVFTLVYKINQIKMAYCYLWFKYKRYLHKCVVVAFNIFIKLLLF